MIKWFQSATLTDSFVQNFWNLQRFRAIQKYFQYPAYIHTYIHNWSLQPFSHDYDLVSHTTYVVCVSFIHEWRDLQFLKSPKTDSERQIFEKLFMVILFTLRVLARNLLGESRPRNIFIFSFWCLTWGLKTDLTSNKPTH